MTPINLPDSLKESELKEIARRFQPERWKVFLTEEDRARNSLAFGMTIQEREESVNRAEEWFDAISSILCDNYMGGYSL